MRSDAVATIFSRSSAPPPPLIKRSWSSISSAPSTVKSRRGVSSSVVSGMPRPSACTRVSSEVGTQTTRKPCVTFSPSASTKRAAVEPEPTPSCVPSSTRSRAARAALSLRPPVLSTGSPQIGAEVSDPPPLHTPPLAHSQGACDRSAMLKGANIVFDLDGTLVDTAPDPTSALNHALTRHLGVSAATVRSAVGLGICVMIEETLRRLGASDDVDEMLAKFLAYYEANIARESWPFPGVVIVLERLAAEGATLAVCTNKQER